MLSLAQRAPLGTRVQLARPASLPLSRPYCWTRRAPIVRLRPAQADFFGKLFGSGEEVDEEGKLVPLDVSSEGGLGGSSEKVFGPLAILAVGYQEDEYARFRDMLIELEAEMIQLIPCSPAMLNGTLGQALSTEPGVHQQMPLGTRRVVFLSGMYAMEVMEVIAFYRESGLPEPVFAAAVPNNWNRNLGQLITDVYEDHQAMRQRAAEAQALRVAQEAQQNSQ